MANAFPSSSLPLQSCRIAIFFGGPSNERNISLDSARTFYDSVRHYVDEQAIRLIFVSPQLSFHLLDSMWIYSNTIEDFEHRKAPALSGEELHRLVGESDVLCPLVHGAFGEDGQLTLRLMEMGRRAITGSPPEGLALTLDKYATTQKLKSLGFPTVTGVLVTRTQWEQDPQTIRQTLSRSLTLDSAGRFIVKPNNCGSSDGVSLVNLSQLDSAMEKAFAHTDQVLVETRILGREFSLIVLQDEDGQPIPLLPTGVALSTNLRTADAEIYSRSKKYLPGAGATHLTPMDVNDQQIQMMRSDAAHLFKAFELEDWARFDGFLTQDGKVFWSDLNGIPGAGLDSFLFQQAALFGLEHRDVFLLLLARGLMKEERMLEIPVAVASQTEAMRVAVIGGGSTSERHVSRMSWFNVTQKLKAMDSYQVMSIFLDQRDQFWEVSPFVALQHTVEEIEHILANPRHYAHGSALAKRFRGSAFQRFGQTVSTSNFAPRQLSLEEVAAACDFVFLALHGGRGEDGRLQRELELLNVPFNGSDSKTAPICMDKVASNLRCQQLGIPGFVAPRQLSIPLSDLRKRLQAVLPDELLNSLIRAVQNDQCPWETDLAGAYDQFATAVSNWVRKQQITLNSPHAIVLKPRGDGCSSGVLVSKNPPFQVPRYLLIAFANIAQIPYSWLYPNTADDSMMLQMPPEGMENLLVEQFLGDPQGKGSFMEMTIGVTGSVGQMQALFPSETLAAGDVLSLDEKFNKGMGVNLTPPPSLSESCVESIRQRVSAFANAFGLRNYARIDIMYHRDSDTIYLIEINTLPGLTAATILYTQALVTPGVHLKPSDFLSYLIQNASGSVTQLVS